MVIDAQNAMEVDVFDLFFFAASRGSRHCAGLGRIATASAMGGVGAATAATAAAFRRGGGALAAGAEH